MFLIRTFNSAGFWTNSYIIANKFTNHNKPTDQKNNPLPAPPFIGQRIKRIAKSGRQERQFIDYQYNNLYFVFLAFEPQTKRLSVRRDCGHAKARPYNAATR